MTATSPIGPSTSGAMPDEGASPGSELRGQIFRHGVSLALALAFLVGGFSLAFGLEDLLAVVAAMITFGVIVVISFFAEVIVEPSLERIAVERDEERKQRELEMMPSAGGVMGTASTLTGGAAAARRALPPAAGGGVGGGVGGRAGGAAGGLKGRALDITLPEETVGPAPASRSGVVGAPPPRAATPPPPRAATAPPATAARTPAAPAAPAAQGEQGAATGGAAAGNAEAGEEGFQDLASLLREASQPSPVPVRPRQ